MTLFRLKVEYDIVVNSDSQEEAEKKANYIMRHDCDDPPSSVVASEIKSTDDLPPGWHPHCRPWGNRTDDDEDIWDLLNKEDEKVK